MTNHVHLLFEAGRDDTLPKSMHWLGTAFVLELNNPPGRKGHLWEGRYRDTIVEAAAHFFRAMAYVVGSPRFVRRMEKRFGVHGPGRSVERRRLGAGVVACGPRLGDPGRRRGHASS